MQISTTDECGADGMPVADLSANRRRAGHRAFSLVEVVIALGILSFAILPIIGLLGGSLQAYRKAINDTVSRQIMTQLAANAQQARLADLEAQPTSTVYFDVEGNPVEPSDPLRVFTATVRNSPDITLLNSPNLYRVQITVTPLASAEAQHTSLQVSPQN